MIHCTSGPMDGKEITDTGQTFINLAHFEDTQKGSKFYSCLYKINRSRSSAKFFSWKLVGTLRKNLT